MKLSLLNSGKTAVISDIQGDTAYRQRLFALGISTGTRVRSVSSAPLSGAVIIEADGSLLALRKEAAELIEVRADE